LSVLGCDIVSPPRRLKSTKTPSSKLKFHRTTAISPEDGVTISKHAVSMNK
jgi:hypothetical protein